MSEPSEIVRKFVDLAFRTSLFLRNKVYHTKKRLSMFTSFIFLSDIHDDYVEFSKIQDCSQNIEDEVLKYASFKKLVEEIESQIPLVDIISIKKTDGEHHFKCSNELLDLIKSADSNFLMPNPQAYEEYKDIEKYL